MVNRQPFLFILPAVFLALLTACSSQPRPKDIGEPGVNDLLATSGVMRPATSVLSHSLACTDVAEACYREALKLFPAWQYPAVDQELALPAEAREDVYHGFADVLPVLEQQAATGDQTAQLVLGLACLRGGLLPLNPSRGTALLQQVADKGNCLAAWRLAVNLFPKNSDQAVYRLRQAAECGYQPARTLLGLLYRDGQRVSIQYEQARYWLSLGAAQGSTEAAANLGLMQYFGIGGIQSREQALNSWRLAAGTGEPRAAYWLGIDAASQASADSLLLAKQYYRQAIPAVKPAWNQLGIMSVRSNRGSDAAEWFEKGATSGKGALAAYNLGCQWHLGKGVPKNDLQAKEWLQLAVNQKLRQAQRLQGYLMWKNSRGSSDYTVAAGLLEAATEQGDIYSLYLLGVMRATGQGLARDFSQAYIRFSVAAAYGSPQAASLRDAVGRQLSSDDLQGAQRRAQQLYDRMLEKGAVLEAEAN